MATVNIYAAKTSLSRLIDAALRGEEVVIARDNKPLVRLVPVNAAESRPRRLGSARGQIQIADDFDAPLADMKDYETGP
jgi:antitoxin (DNA-binding transcriptional repressor) of toxin-antitoxin stability system